MAYDTSNFEEAEYTEVPFVPSASKAGKSALLGGVAVNDPKIFVESNPNYLLRAIAGGLVGALLGAPSATAAFIYLTGWTIGYLAVLVGWLVGKGMMTASEDRGGPQYQVAGIALTYLAVAAGKRLYWSICGASHSASGAYR